MPPVKKCPATCKGITFLGQSYHFSGKGSPHDVRRHLRGLKVLTLSQTGQRSSGLPRKRAPSCLTTASYHMVGLLLPPLYFSAWKECGGVNSEISTMPACPSRIRDMWAISDKGEFVFGSKINSVPRYHVECAKQIFLIQIISIPFEAFNSNTSWWVWWTSGHRLFVLLIMSFISNHSILYLFVSFSASCSTRLLSCIFPVPQPPQSRGSRSNDFTPLSTARKIIEGWRCSKRG